MPYNYLPGRPEFHADANNPGVASFTCPRCRTRNWVAALPTELLREPLVKCRQCHETIARSWPAKLSVSNLTANQRRRTDYGS